MLAFLLSTTYSLGRPKPIVKGIGSEVSHRVLLQLQSILFVVADLVGSVEKGNFSKPVCFEEIDGENVHLFLEMIKSSSIELEVTDSKLVLII